MTIVARQTSLFDLPPASRPSDDMERHADFNADRTCRYSLSCRWAPGPLAAWLLTNPAKASSDRSDQTFLRVHPFARSRSEEHTSELQSLMRSSYAVFCLTQKQQQIINTNY